MDAIAYSKFLLALLLVLGLIWGAAQLLRRFGFGEKMPLKRADRRLRIIETLSLDGRHRALLLRRDGVEHLVVIGPQGAHTVESGITPPAPPAEPAP